MLRRSALECFCIVWEFTATPFSAEYCASSVVRCTQHAGKCGVCGGDGFRASFNTVSCSLTLSGQNNAIVVLLHSTAWLGSVSTTLYMNRVVQRAEPSKPIARRNQAVASRRDRCLHRCFSRLEAMHATICQPGLRQHLLIASVRPIYESRLIFP